MMKIRHLCRLLTKNIPSKQDEAMTVSGKLRNDLLTFFPNHADLNLLELGTYLGYTTRFFSFNFRKIYTLENNKFYFLFSRAYNSDRKNVIAKIFNLYEGDWVEVKTFCEDADLIFIDACHEEKFVETDILHCIKWYPKAALVFDDYGSFPGVFRSVNKCAELGKLKIMTGIGLEKDAVKMPDGRPLNTLGSEGIICQISG